MATNLLGLAVLGAILYQVIWKRRMPDFLIPLYKNQAQFYNDQNNKELTGLLRILNFVVGIICIWASYWAVQLYAYPASNSFFWPICLGIAGMVAFFFADMSRKTYYHYAKIEPVETEKNRLKEAYGAKDWATKIDVSKNIPHVTAPDGSPVGIHIGEGLHWYDKGHMLCVGGSGQGKGVNLLLPAILSDCFVAGGISLVCLDPKGENAAVAAPFLKRKGYDVHVLNPFGIQEIADLGNSCWNPFDLIDDESNDASKLYDVLAMAIHNRKGDGDGSFFDSRCRQYISLYLNYANFMRTPDWTLIYKWFSYSGDKRQELLASMASYDFDGADLAQAISDRLTGDAAKTEENIFGTVEEAINILKDKNLRASLSASDFDMRTIAQKSTAIFVCIPFEELGYYAAWVRMFFNFLLRTLTRYYNSDRKILVLLDEFPQLSYMDEVTRSAAVLRGYNVTLWTVVQDLGQLKSIYKDKWETFISNSVVKHWLSSGADNTTADYLSHRMPQALKFIGNNADGSPKEIQTKLLDPNQVMGFKNIICEIAGMDRPAKFDKVPYWELPFSKNNAEKNPFYAQKQQ